MKKLGLVVSLVILIALLLLINPYNLFHYLSADNKVSSVLADPTVRLELLDDDTEITNVKYLGSHMYRVETKTSTYVVEIKVDKSKRFIQVFEHKHQFGVIYE